jgi:hypothetical protein
MMSSLRASGKAKATSCDSLVCDISVSISLPLFLNFYLLFFFGLLLFV